MTNKRSEDTAEADAGAEPVSLEEPAAPTMRSVEQWGEARGWLPALGPDTGMGPRINPAYWKYLATTGLMKARGTWRDDQQQVTEEEFDKAVEEQLGLRHG